MTTTVTSATSLAPLQMHLPTDPPSDPNALGFALLAAEDRLQEGDDQMLDLAFEIVHNIGQKVHALKDEKARLQSDISLQQRRIEILETLHQEKWTAHLEGTRVRMRLISSDISKIIQSIDSFRATTFRGYPLEGPYPSPDVKEKMMKSTGPVKYCCIVRVLFIQYSCRHSLNEWLKMTDTPIDKSLEKNPKYTTPPPIVKSWSLIPQKLTQEQSFFQLVPCARKWLKIADREELPKSTQIVKVVAGPQALTPVESFPRIARFVQNKLALEREVTNLKQELQELEQTRVSNEKKGEEDLRVFIAAMNHLIRNVAFAPSLRSAQSLQRSMESYIENSTKQVLILESWQSPLPPFDQPEWAPAVEKAMLEEAKRLKGMIDATLPHIEEALEWTRLKQETEE